MIAFSAVWDSSKAVFADGGRTVHAPPTAADEDLFWGNWETVFYGRYRSIFNHCDIIGLSENMSNSVTKRKVMGVTAFKVIPGHRSRPVPTPLCAFCLVINRSRYKGLLMEILSITTLGLLTELSFAIASGVQFWEIGLSLKVIIR